MISKTHLLQNLDSMMKATKNAHNAKVTVQYIQTPQLYLEQENVNHHNIEHICSQDLEIENVEYLEDNANVEEFIEDTDGKEEDIFYPNAIHCLLDLYKRRYESLVEQNSTANVAQPWRDIAKEMQESLFVFNEHQIKHKFAALREQYFSLQDKNEIENFDYFSQLHDIYKDQCKEDIMTGHNGTKIISYYKDEIFLQPERLEINEVPMPDFKSEEIVHKEHEFIDMVEKELQAMQSGKQVNTKDDSKIKIDENEDSISSTDLSGMEPAQNKKPRLDDEFCEEMKKSNKYIESKYLKENCTHENKNELSLYTYNKEQERRHREKMSLLEKSLEIQERVLEQQQQLLRELIKRLPS